ncbi:MAG: SdiA-regulated domain-containing protein [Flavobacteriales bacterium]|nr:SdiA-regulated domain-containing protein [Flavobacteriales bacterium]
MIRLSILFVLVACFGVSRQPSKGSDTPYNMAKPSAVLHLPMALREVSALTDVDSVTVACVEDEQATVHFLSLHSGAIVSSFPFHGQADMEGLTRVGGTFYALRSDGLLYHLGGVDTGLSILDTVHLQLANSNIEGLGYDEKQHRILVSPKDVLNDDRRPRMNGWCMEWTPKS